MPRAVRISAASTHVNGPNVETISSSEPTAARRCSEPSTRQAARSSEILPPAEARIDLVPVRDLVLAFLPAEVDLAAVAHGREVDQSALEVAHDHLDRVELARRRLQFEERFRDDTPGLAAPVARRRLAEGFAGVLVGEAIARGAQALESFSDP